MRTVTIREAQHNLSKILQEVEAGATVQITRRRTPLARLIPEPTLSGRAGKVDWKGHANRLIQPRHSSSQVDSTAVLDDLRGDR